MRWPFSFHAGPSRLFLLGSGLRRRLVDEVRQADIAGAEAARVVRRQNDIDTIVDIEPFRMMVHPFHLQGDARHEAEGLVEILEAEGPVDGVPAGDDLPTRKLGKGSGAIRG